MIFSIITPSKNDDFYLNTCIQSIQNQSQKNYKIEHIIQVNSPKITYNEIKKKNYTLKKFLEPDNGMYHAINNGIKKSKGDIISYLSSDEQYNENTLSIVKKYFKANKNCELLIANTIFTDETGKYLYHKKAHIPDYYSSYWNVPASAPCSWFIKRSVFTDKKLYFDQKWKTIADKIWLLNATKNKLNIKYLNHLTSIFFKRKNNLGSSNIFHKEVQKFNDLSPIKLKITKYPLLTIAYIKKIYYKAYSQKPFSYTVINPQNKEKFTYFVNSPTTRNIK